MLRGMCNLTSFSNFSFRIGVFLFSFLFFLSSSFKVTAAGQHVNRDDFLLGLYIAAQVEKKHKVLNDHKDWPRVKEIASRLMAESSQSHVYTFQIIEAPVANAFALPGGFVFITDKLLDLKLNDDELAFLVGHEISHVSEKHFSRMMQEQTKVSVANAIAMVGAAVLANLSKNNSRRMVNQGNYERAGAPKIGDHSHARLPSHLIPLLAGNIFGTLYLLHSKRDYEFEADLIGAKLAMQAGYSLDKGLGMLKKLFYTNYRDIRYEQWQTHPLTNKRTQTLESKLGLKKSNKKKSDGFLEDYRERYCNSLLKIYDDLVLWNSPKMIKSKVLYKDLRIILLDRIRHFNDSEIIKRSVLRKEIQNHYTPVIAKQSFLRADYGLLYEKMKELKKIGGLVDEKEMDKLKIKYDQNLKIHIESMESKTPSWMQYAYMIKNFPNHKNVKHWQWQNWKMRGDLKEKINNAHEIKSIIANDKLYFAELKNIERRIKKNPYYYNKIKKLQQEKIDEKEFKTQVKQCESLVVLSEFQHEHPGHPMIKVILERKSELLKKQLQQAKLAVISKEYFAAVQGYHDILLYGNGSDLEEHAKRQIYKLNTVKRKDNP
jgi:Zn-dependent protease with chaperone function